MANMKIMTLNIWHYEGNWNIRKNNIIKAVLAEKPDILFMQEVADDQMHQAKDGLHQGEQLNARLKYKNLVYDVAEQIRIKHDNELSHPLFEGVLCLTSLPLLAHRVLRLKREKEDKHYRAIQLITVSWFGKEVLFYHTHYSNTNEWSRSHLEETRRYMVSKNASPILIGDLNILDSRVIKNVLGSKFECSYEFKKYLSFPSENITLDYIVIPKTRYRFKSLKCNYDNCSDHRALIAEIDFGNRNRSLKT